MKPQLGHYRIEIDSPSSGTIAVVPANDDPLIYLWINRDTAMLAALNSRQARQVAQALIVCAERLDYPNAVAGPEAWS